MTIRQYLKLLPRNIVTFFACIGIALTATSAHAQNLNVWLTTPDLQSPVALQPILNFAPGTSDAANTITVDVNNGYQQIDGFGADFSDLTTYLMTYDMSSSQQAAFLQMLFSPNPTGAGFNIIRTAMGSNDQVYNNCYNSPTPGLQQSGCASPQGTYDDNNGVADPSLSNFSIAHDVPYIIPQMQAALQVNPGLHVLATAWVQPNWMMIPDTSPCSGQDDITMVDPSLYQSEANYFVKYVQAYGSYGIPIWAISPQNEPCIPALQQQADLDPANADNLLKDYAVPAFAANNLATQFQPEMDNYCSGNQVQADYAQTIGGDTSLAPNLLGLAWHSYCGDATVMTNAQNNYNVNVYTTEVGLGAPYPSSDLTAAVNLPLAALRNWAKTFLWHALANSTSGTLGTCNVSECGPLIEINTSNGNVVPLLPFYAIEQFSEFIHPGAYEVYSSWGTPSGLWTGNLETVAAKNPDGSMALVVQNMDPSNTQALGIQWGGLVAYYSLPANSVATFTWPGSQNSSNVEVDDEVFGTGLDQLSYSGSGWGHCTNCDQDNLGRYDASNSWDYTSGDSVSMSFSGPFINVYEGVGPAQGLVNVYIDGIFQQTVNGYSPVSKGNTLIYSTPMSKPLGAGTHALELVNAANTGLVLDRVEIVTPVTTSIDDSVIGSGQNQFNYTGSDWGHCTNCDSNPDLGRYDASNSWDQTMGDSVSLAFSGSAITLYVVKGLGGGYADVSIDGGPSTRIDTYASTTNGNQVGWVSPTLTEGAHTMSVKVDGRSGAYNTSGDNYVIIDRAEIVP